jgi:hypothetical protein
MPGSFAALFSPLFVLAVVWLILIVWTFRRLQSRHPAAYEAIGSPSLFWNNSPRNNWLFVRFLFRGDWQNLGDAALAVVARSMQLLFVLYVAGFFGLIAMFLYGVI